MPKSISKRRLPLEWSERAAPRKWLLHLSVQEVECRPLPLSRWQRPVQAAHFFTDAHLLADLADDRAIILCGALSALCLGALQSPQHPLGLQAALFFFLGFLLFGGSYFLAS